MPVRRRRHHVIIGASAAGLSALEAIRSVDPACAITVVSKERLPLYSRVGLTHFLDGTVKAAGMHIAGGDYFTRHRASLLAGVSAVRVDARARTVALSNGTRLAYDALLVASGSSAVRLPIPGAGLRGVYTCITRNDALAIDRAIARTRRAAVIGAGLIGIQAADALAKRQRAVAVIEEMPHVMPAMADATAARLFEARLAGAGHTVRTGVRAAALRGKAGRVTGVELETGEFIPCQLVVMAAGVRPNLEYLEPLRIQRRRGILVDSFQRTSLAHIYAAGDVAETVDMFSGQRVVQAIWPEALLQGRVAGLNMAGAATPYEGSMAMNTTSVLGLPVASLGVWQVTDTIGYTVHSAVDPAKGEYRKLVFRDGRLAGAVLVGDCVNREAGILHTVIRSRQSFAETPAALAAGPISWGRILRDTRFAGRMAT
jgi:NAD(P)H-nitrite reductase large subunit